MALQKEISKTCCSSQYFKKPCIKIRNIHLEVNYKVTAALTGDNSNVHITLLSINFGI